MGFVNKVVYIAMLGVSIHLIIVRALPVSNEISLQPLDHSLNGTPVNESTTLNSTKAVLNNTSFNTVNGSVVENGIGNINASKNRTGKLIGFELGLGLGPGLGYGGYGYGGGYGNVPFPCSTTRLAAFGFPYYNPVCYGYAVPSFPYYGGPLG